MRDKIQKGNPTVSDLHVDAALTDVSVAYDQAESAFVAGTIFPVVPVQKKSDQFYEYLRADWHRSDAKGRAPGAPIAMSGWRLSQTTYNCERYGLGHAITDPERDNADPAVQNLEGDATDYLTQQLLLRDETDWVSAFFATSIWTGASSTTDMTGASTAPASTGTHFLQWDNVASTPIEDIHGEQGAVQKRTGKKPNTLAIGWEVWNHLRDHPDVLDRIKFTQTGIPTADLLAALFDVDRVVVASAMQDTAVEGSTTVTNAYLVGKNALLCYVPASPGLKTPSAGYQFVWVGRTGTPATGRGARMKRYRNEPLESDIIEAEKWRDFKVIGADLGAFFSAAVG